MADLQRRLAAAGHSPGDPAGEFGESTAAAVRGFQQQAGLRSDGVCDTATWAALVESEFRLGDRLVCLRSPMMRGNDVAELQLRLGALGFDAGRVDGIFGPDTARALSKFQKSCGVPADGVCGPETIALLERLSRQTGSGPGVAVLREAESLRSERRQLATMRIVVGHDGGLEGQIRGTGCNLAVGELV